MKKGTIILLNGVSSAGKSTLTKAIQRKLDTPYYHICCDDFMNMTPKHILTRDFDNQLLITQGIMHETILLFSEKGHNVIVDDVVLDLPDKNDWLYEYSVILQNSNVLFVKVNCGLDELRRREIKRGDRSIGQSEWQLGNMDNSVIYDLEVDTSINSTEVCADQIISKLNDNSTWGALKLFKEKTEKFRLQKI
ncbi:chloramphenicol phosphotransferase CPT family protein [Clostridium hydrogenum]|uniref:chloramphenicol phosphotransferase CPT family protein n=1 Tax=Clostridium hydrogenum TaxID=2855764 RepID=UPI001F4369FD|nr:AAA family ATPase [Clostridium hydrogenum]